MTAAEFIALRKRMGMTQGALANLLDMSLRAVQDIENERSSLRTIHALAIERLTLSLAASYGAADWIPPAMMQEIQSVVADRAARRASETA